MTNIETCDCACCVRWRVKFLGRHAGIEAYDAFRTMEQKIFDMADTIEIKNNKIKSLNLIIQQLIYLTNSSFTEISPDVSRVESPDCDDPQ